MTHTDERYLFWDPYQQRQRDFRFLDGRELKILLHDVEVGCDRDTADKIRAYLAEAPEETDEP